MSKPTVKLLLSHPAHFFSLGLGSGLFPVAPGTAGSILAWPLYWLLREQFSFAAFGVLIAACFAAGVWMCGLTGRALGVSDHGAIVWDEIVAVWLVMWLVPQTWLWQLAALAVFRLFDILKPWPIRVADKRFKNGFGVMFDDLLAALFSLAVLWIAQVLFFK